VGVAYILFIPNFGSFSALPRYPRKNRAPSPLYREAGWAEGPVLVLLRGEIYLSPD